MKGKGRWVGIGVCGALLLVSLGAIFGWWDSAERGAEQVVEARLEAAVGVPVAAETGVQTPVLPFLPVNLQPLQKKNADVVGWLRVGGSKLDMPIVQTTDNSYYLTHDLEKKPNKLGWVFADSRSGMETLGYNTVLYGHNAANRSMFGSLKLLVDQNFEGESKYIQYTTSNWEYVFEVSSIYVTDYEDWDYVKQVFTSEDAKSVFVKRMKAKNQNTSLKDVHVSTSDQYLTFSTCYGPAGTTKRLVVHAKLIGQQKPQPTKQTS